MKKDKPFKLNKKEICITSSQIKQAIDLLVNENEILQDRIYELEEVLDKIKEYIKVNMEEYGGDIYLTCKEIKEILEELDGEI